METMREIFLPKQYSVHGKLKGNSIEQVLRSSSSEPVKAEIYSRRTVSGFLVTRSNEDRVLIVNKKIKPPKGINEVLVVPKGSIFDDREDFQSERLLSRWISPKSLAPNSNDSSYWANYCDDVRRSWEGQFLFKEESQNGVGAGLRPAQTGAIYAVLAHWKITLDPATVVMPTGTGKTETMLALLVHERLPKLLVVVPTDALREQISNKFRTLGVLKTLNIVGRDAKYPLVGTLTKRPSSPEDVEEYFSRCNVVVTTMAIAGSCSESVQAKMAESCSHLFIDEAHHVPAPSWEAFRKAFKTKPIVQFTATPFRTDGKHIDGKVIFNYPLRKAQAEGYFKPIKFRSINEFSPQSADRQIAKIALEQLDLDLAANLDHILMARASSIARAGEIYKIYLEKAGNHNPIIIHNKLTRAKRFEAMRKISQRETRVIICVQMLGEGFDLPELKIAALHDVHKSLAITLQFTGRFTRVKNTIGDATVVANIAAPGVEDSLCDLYAEDADWNSLLRVLSEGATGKQIKKTEFINNFSDVPTEVPLQNIFPKMSTVVYKTKCSRWQPEKACDQLHGAHLFAGPTINHTNKVVLFITRETEAVPWGAIKEVHNTEWQLYLAHWNEDLQLLFINSSNNASSHEELAKAIAGDNVELIRGEQVFRTLQSINFLILMNLGLNHVISRAMRFTMYMGADITSALKEPEQQNKTKSNLFGSGFENGQEVTIGCSRKGKIWSYKIAYDMADWVEWCKNIGTKLVDETITTDLILKNLILPVKITERPSLVPLTIEWPEDFLSAEQQCIQIEINRKSAYLFETGLDLIDNTKEGSLKFRLSVEDETVDYEVKFVNNRVEYKAIDSSEALVTKGRKTTVLSEIFQKSWPIIRFENCGYLNYDELCIPPSVTERAPFDHARIQVVDWSGVNLGKESQTHSRYIDSIQYRAIEILSQSNEYQYDVIFDDDGKNEIADIVALRIDGDRLLVHLYHCKFSKEPTPGARVEDLYAVCGQAQRSVYWKSSVGNMIQRLRYREDGYFKRHSVSRFQKGDLTTLAEIARKAPYLIPDFKVIIIQPGLSKAAITTNQLELLAATEMYLNETYAVDFEVIGSS